MKQTEKLALHGGKPVRDSYLSYGSQWVTERDIEFVVETMRSPFLTQGPKIVEFERAVAEQAGTEYAVAFCNGTAALHGAIFAAGIAPGDEVITTPLTFAATSNAVLYQGGTPVFADIDPETYLLDVSKVEELITPQTKVIVPVDFAGQPVNMRAFRELADRQGLIYIQDAAHSFGASYAGEPVGSVADMTMFSFHPVKPITTGEGGVIVTNNREYYERLLRFRSHGITKDARFMERESQGPWYYEMIELGYNYRMTDIQAALGIVQLERIGEFIERRQEIAKRYDEAFQAYGEWLVTPNVAVDASSGWHLYVISLRSQNLTGGRKEIFEALQAENIGVNVHYIPVHFHPYYEKLGYKKESCLVAEQAYETFITLPLFPRMSEQDIEDVVQAMDKVISFYKK